MTPARLLRLAHDPGPAAASGLSAPGGPRYDTDAEAAFARVTGGYFDRFWEAGRNLGANAPWYAGAASDQCDSLSGSILAGPGAAITLGGDGLYVQDIGGSAAAALSGRDDIIPLGRDFTLAYCVEPTGVDGGIIAGSLSGAVSFRFALAITRGLGSLKIDNQPSGGDLLAARKAFVVGRRDLVWAAWRNVDRTMSVGRRVAAPAETATWAAGFAASVRGEQIGTARSLGAAFHGGILGRARMPFYGPDEPAFAALLDALAAKWKAAD